MTEETSNRRKGFAAIDPQRQREIASMGGKASQNSGRGHRFTTDSAKKAAAQRVANLARKRAPDPNPSNGSLKV